MSGRKRSSPSKHEEKSPKFIKGVPPPPAAEKVTERNATVISAGNTIATCKLKSDDIIGLTRSNLDKHAFVQPLVSSLQSNEDGGRAKAMLAVHYIGWERNPHQPNQYREDERKKAEQTMNPRYRCFVSIVPSDKAHQNNVVNRERWAKNIIKLNNCPRIQNQYRFGATPLYYKGDVTPINAPPPPMSQFLTIRDTMEVIRIAYKTPEGEKPDIQDLLADETLLSNYYDSDLIPQVHEFFMPKRKDGDDGTNHGDEFDQFEFI